MSRIDIERFRALEAEGLLFINRHPEAPLLIHNYSQKVQYERLWRPETLRSRGLITDLTGRIVARPFGKFFNLAEYLEYVGPVPEESFEVFEKMDGSLGILYFIGDQPFIATRGSFSSEQAITANRILRERYAAVKFDPQLTYLFEIIYPENRIVVNYGDMEALVLLAVIDTATGEEFSLDLIDLPLPKVKRYAGIADLHALRALEEENREGFVVRFRSGLRVKVKFAEYVRLHKIISGVTVRFIWEQVSAGKALDDVLEHVPDEFYAWVREVEADLHAQYRTIEAEARRVYRELPTRRETAAYFNGLSINAKILFRMLDGKTYDDVIWRMLRPEYRTPFNDSTQSGVSPAGT
ncbi:MAG: RNA ligase [Bacteroidota bacterium]